MEKEKTDTKATWIKEPNLDLMAKALISIYNRYGDTIWKEDKKP
jgi:hypothetical protein